VLDPNGILRLWRTSVLGVKQNSAAELVGLSHTTMNELENSNRISKRHVDRLDEGYGAQGMLKQLVAAAATPGAFDARTHWDHNFEDDDSDVWAWVRFEDPAAPFACTCHWGAFEVTMTPADVDAVPNGFFLTSSVSLRLPAVFFTLEPAGWVSFGSGIPPADLGIPVVSGLSHLRRFSGSDNMLGLLSHWVRRTLRERFPDGIPSLGNLGTVARELFAARDHPQVQDIGPGPLDRPGPFGSRIIRVREARRMSQQDLAAAVSAAGPEWWVTDDQVGRVEKDQGVRVSHIRSGIDRVLNGDGRLCCDEVSPSDDGTFAFPPSYSGPVWLEVDNPGPAAAEITLHWGEWIKRVSVASTAVLSLRHTGGLEHLSVGVKEGVVIRAGTGWREGAANINDDWVLESPDAERRWWERSRQLMMQVLGLPGAGDPPTPKEEAGPGPGLGSGGVNGRGGL
jgi:hypothetical protein